MCRYVISSARDSMTTGPEGVVKVAEAAGLPVTSVDRAAKLLKQASPRMWARSPQGGGHKAEHLQAPHLTNIVLALAMADPSSRAVEVAEAYRALYPITPLSTIGPNGNKDFRFPWGARASLGDSLDHTLRGFRGKDGLRWRELWRGLGFHVVLEADPPRATVRFREDPSRDTEYYGKGHDVGEDENPQAPRLPRSFMQRPAILTCELFEALADLLEAPAEDADAPQVSSQDIPGPEKENAGLPGPASPNHGSGLPKPLPPINNASLLETTPRQHAHASGTNTRERSVRDPLPSRGAECMAGQLRSWPRDTSPPHHP